VQHVPAPAWNRDSHVTRTPHICCSRCDRWHTHHWKEPSSEIGHEEWGRSMSASDSLIKKVGQYGLTFKAFFMWSHILGHCTRSSDDHYHVNFTWEQWTETVTTVLYKLKFILGAYCVGVVTSHPPCTQKCYKSFNIHWHSTLIQTARTEEQ
jgi:hypothetical protein